VGKNPLIVTINTEGHPFAATYFFNGKEEVWSLRSRGESGIDVSETDLPLKKASGFQVLSNISASYMDRAWPRCGH
jgi:hypothetical protein